MRNFLAGLSACAVVLCAGYGLASRNSAGTMSPANGPYVSGTVINSSQINARFADIENELTDSLSRSAKGGMTAPLKGSNGTVAAPAFSWTSEPGSGLYRIGASDFGFAVNGAKVHEWTATGETVTGTLSVTDVLTQTLAGSGTVGAASFFEPSLLAGNAIQLRLGTSATNNAAALWSFIPNATAALSTGCLGVFGVSASIACVDGNQKTSLSGALVTAGGVTIGTGGTALSKRLRGTTSWTPGSIPSLGGASKAITLTGAVAGADCHATPPDTTGTLRLTCAVTTDTCTIAVANAAASAETGVIGTYSCVVENP